jgi:hypothetical protein
MTIMPDTAQELAEAYLGALGCGDLHTMAGLFSDGAMVHSPLASGQRAPFDVVDVLELAADDRIAALHIVDDTADVRPVFENETRRPSWHAGQSRH